MEEEVSRKQSNILELCVSQIVDVATGVRCFTLVAPDQAELPPFEPGSHVDVHLPGGFVRQYSLCNAPTDRSHYELAVKREDYGRGGSRAMHSIRAGSTITIGYPRNSFSLSPSATKHILIAGGIGVTPLLSMYRHLRSTNVPVEFHYSARSMEYAAFSDELSRDPEYVSMLFSSDPVEVMAYFRKRLSDPHTGEHVYICGPSPFMDAIVESVNLWPSDAIHQERFSATSKTGTGDFPFVVELASSGETVIVESNRTIVDALREVGVHINTSCEQGICGTCLTNVIDGIPDHRDSYLTEEERAAGKLITPCVSRCKKNRLVLDL